MKHTLGHNRLPVLAACALLALGTVAQTAQAQITLDFEFLNNPNNVAGVNFQNFSVTQNGFTITHVSPNAGLYSVSPNGGNVGFNYTGSVALLNGATDTTTLLTKDNGNTFTLNSIDLANNFLQSHTSGGDTVEFTGNVQGGGTVTQSFTLAASNALQTFTFGAGFTNLTSVSFLQDAPYNQFDNIVITAVPGPEALPVFGGGLLLGIWRLRRRRK